jgi:hypothetical protein
MSDRRGVALIIALAAVLLVESLTLVALEVAATRLRLAGDARWRVEAGLVAESGLGIARVANRTSLDNLADGGVLRLAPVFRGDGWSWRGVATRTGALIRLVVTARRMAADGRVHASRRASLLLIRDPADTVRVLAHRPRF